jgi:preprotein translocase subunit YajC
LDSYFAVHAAAAFFLLFFSLPFVLLITERYILLRPHKKRQKLMMDLKREAFLVARE